MNDFQNATRLLTLTEGFKLFSSDEFANSNGLGFNFRATVLNGITEQRSKGKNEKPSIVSV